MKSPNCAGCGTATGAVDRTLGEERVRLAARVVSGESDLAVAGGVGHCGDRESPVGVGSRYVDGDRALLGLLAFQQTELPVRQRLPTVGGFRSDGR